jgi:hypothetical protein
MEVSGYPLAPVALPLEKEPHYLLNRRVGGHHTQFAYFDGKKNLLHLLGLEPQIAQPI